mmetsp:Transcript_60891/g.193165  ORF Transcript_60891/g.193165 Transcript_60891/m.193165 type:complete len:359 (-) Transcript_60891:533-1609(-)
MGKWKVVTGLRLSSFIPGRIKSLSFGTKHAGALRGGKKTRVLPTDDDQEPSPGALQEDRKKIIRRVYSESKIELDVVEVELGYGHRWVLNPHTPFRRRWDIMQMVILFYISIMVPVRVGFSRTAEGPAYVFEFLIDLYFDVDVVLNFLTGLENDDGALLYDLKVIGKRYLRGWFWVDFLACVPIDLILRGVNGQIECSFTDTCDGEDSSAGAGAIKLLKLLRLARLMKLLRLMRISRRSFISRARRSSLSSLMAPAPAEESSPSQVSVKEHSIWPFTPRSIRSMGTHARKSTQNQPLRYRLPMTLRSYNNAPSSFSSPVRKFSTTSTSKYRSMRNSNTYAGPSAVRLKPTLTGTMILM